MRRAAGVEPHLSPPASLETVTPGLFEEWDFIYIKLHGWPGDPYWYNDEGYRVVSADVLRRADLGGAVVYCSACYLPETPMLGALLGAGASYVIGGSGLNWYYPGRLSGIDLLGLYVRWKVQRGVLPDKALMLAQRRLFAARLDKVSRDTRAFRVWEGWHDLSRVRI